MPRQRHIQGCGVQLCVTTRGNPASPAIVLVHGYPDNQQVWNPVATLLEQDWYVVTYDVRGAGLSDRPARSRDYRMALLARDLEAVVNAILPGRRFHIVGHDWGSIQTWESVTSDPLRNRIVSYTTLSGPCLDHVGYWMRSHLQPLSLKRITQLTRQMTRSWYIGAFHLPWLAPMLWNRLLGKRWPDYLKASEGITETEPNPYQIQDGRDGIRLYRANMLRHLLFPRVRYAHCPVQLIVPAEDRYVGEHLFDDLHKWVPALYRRDVEAGHWVPLKQPEQLAHYISGFANSMATGNVPAELEARRTKQPNHCAG